MPETTLVATAPGRCGLVGNPTDMYGGSVLSCSLSERARCTLRPHAALVVASDDGTEQILRTPADLAPRGDRLDLAKAVLRGMGIDPAVHHFHLSTSTDIPMQAGLAGSTALTAAVYGAVAHHLGRSLPPHATAEAIRDIEYRILGVICGFQDQYMAVFGGLNFLDFRDKGSHIEPEDQPYATVEPLADLIPGPLPLLLAHTGFRHHSGAAHKPVRQRWLDGDPEVRTAYDHLQSLARWTKSALLASDWDRVADAMNENMAIQQRLGASGEACDRLAAVARDNGARAAKLAGAGQGGTVLALTDDPERLAKALAEAGAGRILIPEPSRGLDVVEA
ncbi:MAG: galactokinase family protein [Armatimonadota bacterium]